MKTETVRRLHCLNQEFYQTFAQSFSVTRQRIQPGIRRIFETFPLDGNYLDIGCGNGTLAQEWLASKKQGMYCGLDFSQELLADARCLVKENADVSSPQICFMQTDLMQPDWHINIQKEQWDGAFLFAVLHHIPGEKTRERICADIARLLKPEAQLFISVWQVFNSKRLERHIVGWDFVDLKPEDIDEGDILMDWRAEPGADSQKGLRYLHVFSGEELIGLAGQSGFLVESSFNSDGKEGNLGLYQIWRKKSLMKN